MVFRGLPRACWEFSWFLIIAAVCFECLVGKQNKPTLLKVTEPVAEEEEEEEDLFVFNDTIEGPRAPAVKPGRVTQA
jgi:hypothetical protein